jgi:hypothetical protein
MKNILFVLLVLLGMGAQAQNIDRAEYFVDSDPGIGKATDIPVNAGELADLNFSVPTTSLANGFHNLFLRVRTEAGIWGLCERRMFYVIQPRPDAGDIVAAEYFIDTDPGIGRGISMTVTSGGNVAFSGAILPGALPSGVHSLFIRVKSDGRWSLYEQRAFYISASPEDVTDVVAAEYFIDSDPGLGNGSPLAFTAGAAVARVFEIQVPVGMTDGRHYLFIRTRNATGKWSLFERDDFTVDGSLPVTGMELTAKAAADQMALLKWFTYTEINNSHFDVERSANAIQFEKIGEVKGSGTTSETMHYQFVDRYPLPGMNYYRLRQIDYDGKPASSRIVYLMFGADPTGHILYPNPAVDFVNLKYTGEQREVLVRVYNSSGQCLKSDIYKTSEQIQMDVRTMETGIYHVQLSDGIRQFVFRLLKK